MRRPWKRNKNLVRLPIILVISLILMIIGCALTKDARNEPIVKKEIPTKPAPKKEASVSQIKKPAFMQKGLASWYGKKFNGMKTASGELFNSKKLTAAHRTLPFGTKVKVTNLANGKWVYVIINDRGPFNKKRIIDVSEKAALILGMKKKGIARVSIVKMDGL